MTTIVETGIPGVAIQVEDSKYRAVAHDPNFTVPISKWIEDTDHLSVYLCGLACGIGLGAGMAALDRVTLEYIAKECHEFDAEDVIKRLVA
jgi:hypothetical protein